MRTLRRIDRAAAYIHHQVAPIGSQPALVERAPQQIESKASPGHQLSSPLTSIVPLTSPSGSSPGAWRSFVWTNLPDPWSLDHSRNGSRT